MFSPVHFARRGRAKKIVTDRTSETKILSLTILASGRRMGSHGLVDDKNVSKRIKIDNIKPRERAIPVVKGDLERLPLVPAQLPFSCCPSLIIESRRVIFSSPKT